MTRKVRPTEHPRLHITPVVVSGRDWRHVLTEKCWCKPKVDGNVITHRDQWTDELAPWS